MNVRTRFAPSPTGHVHIGNIRAAIYNWLFARHEGGQFLLRIEDTDRERSTPEAIQTLLDAMNWIGLDYDKEPLYQSTRIEAHLEAAEQLLSKGLAYKEDKGNTGQGEAIVFRMPDKDMVFHDKMKGTLRKPAESLNDLVLVRSNGTPVFHLANVLDDIEMGITHVIRGDDHIENTYRHVALYEALDAPIPQFAHLPMIVNRQGKPYSKRDGDAFVGDFREKGYLPEALFNYLTLLGWSPGDDREKISRDETISLFDIKRVKSAPAQMDLDKLYWMNGAYLQAMPNDQFKQGCIAVLKKQGLWTETLSEDYIDRVFDLMRERIKCFPDIVSLAGFFFTEEYDYDEKAVNKRIKKEGALDRLLKLKDQFVDLAPFDVETIESVLRGLAEDMGISPGGLIHPVRVATSGLPMGPSLFEMLEVLGKDRVIERIDRTSARFNPNR